MTSSKRSRADTDFGDEDEIEIEIESASSHFRPSQTQKRPRVSLARENGGSVVSDDEDVIDVENYEDAIMQDGMLPDNYSEAAEEEVDELLATQAFEKQMRDDETRARNNMASEQGVIEEVFCRNFMCHSKLRVRLGPLINFIIGHNGSGKSAVLTALQMCLGGKAQATNRATNLKGMIKEGEDSATVAVKIKNGGEDAYRPELYGQSITVERHFSRAGTSGFKIKSDQDKTITTKKADLDDILDFFAFQLDNPINVLSQDMARQFLSNSSPSEKYKFFIRGTQLEALDADYKLLEEHLDNIEIKLGSRFEDVALLKTKAAEAEKRKKAGDQIATIEEKIRHLQYMHAWAQVEEVETIIEKSRQKVEGAKEKVQEKQDHAENTGSILEGHSQALDAAKNTISDLEGQLGPVQDRRVTEKETFDNGKKELTDLLGQQRLIRSNMKTIGDLISARQDEVELEQNRLAGAQGPEHVERLERLAEAKNGALEAKQGLNEHVAGRSDLEHACAQSQKNLEPGKETLAQSKRKRDQAKAEWQRMQRERPEPYAGYRPNMANLVRAVDRETRWRRKPVGPMGAHVELLDETWTSQIEKTFGNALDSFVVSCKADAELLNDIAKRIKCPASVVIGDATPLDTSGKEPEGDVKTILRVLRIDEPAVRNQLIINNAIDQTVLIEDREKASQFMYSSGRPRNVRATICLANDRRRGVRFEYSGRGEQRAGPVDAWQGVTRMKSDHDTQIRIQKNNYDLSEQEVDAVESALRVLQSNDTTAKQALTRFKRRHDELKLALERAEDNVEALQTQIENNRPQDGKLQELERQLTDARSELESAKDSYRDSVDAIDSINKTQAGAKSRLDEAQRELDQMDHRVEQARERVKELELDRSNALREHNLAHQKIDDAKKEVTRAETKLQNDERDLVEMNGQAMQVTPNGRVPVEPGMTPKIIDERLEKLIEDARRHERRIGGNREELTLAYHNAMLEFQEAEGQLKDMENVASELKKTLSNRQYRWSMFRKYISARARITFTYLLSERQFRGRVLMDHQAKELDIKVEPDLTKQSDAGREAKTLSGGEKSFSTICLLLSIWDAMGSPIRCLDEFDVFMDSVNRSTSMSMMIQAARRAVGRQFILITPQAMNNVEMGPDVRIHRMLDPERGQQVLPY